jgi:hypothetical protein
MAGLRRWYVIPEKGINALSASPIRPTLAQVGFLKSLGKYRLRNFRNSQLFYTTEGFEQRGINPNFLHSSVSARCVPSSLWSKVDLSQVHFGTIPSGMNPREVAAQLAALPQVGYAGPKHYS